MKKVLVLEDESSIRSFIVINLRRAGYQVVEAETGEQALELLDQHSDVRVALLDIMLPGIDGFEVCRRIRATNPTIGIIMLTARSQEMDKVTGLMTGADDYVTKPFSPSIPATAPWRRTASASSSPRWSTPSSKCSWRTPARRSPARRSSTPSGDTTISVSSRSWT